MAPVAPSIMAATLRSAALSRAAAFRERDDFWRKVRIPTKSRARTVKTVCT